MYQSTLSPFSGRASIQKHNPSRMKEWSSPCLQIPSSSSVYVAKQPSSQSVRQAGRQSDAPLISSIHPVHDRRRQSESGRLLLHTADMNMRVDGEKGQSSWVWNDSIPSHVSGEVISVEGPSPICFLPSLLLLPWSSCWIGIAARGKPRSKGWREACGTHSDCDAVGIFGRWVGGWWVVGGAAGRWICLFSTSSS